jgi:predicted nucleotidyltransferase
VSDLDLLAAELGVSGRTLRRAGERGAIRFHRSSPHTVEIAVGERRYLRRHWRLLDTLTRALRTEPNVRLVVLFGSTARGDDRDSSDVDLLVDLADPHRRLPLARLGLKLEPRLDRPVALVALDDAEGSAALLSEVLRDGRVLIDRGGRWPKMKRRERALARQAAADAERAQQDAWQAFAELAR